MRRIPAPARLIALFATLMLAACSDDASSPTAAPRPTETATRTATTIPSPTATASATQPPGSPSPSATSARTSTPAATASGTVPAGPIDGTVAPENFGSTEPFTIKSNPDPAPGAATLVDVRIGAHPEQGGWDRIVFEFRDTLPAGEVRYVPDVAACGSGAPVTLPGRAVLAVRFTSTAAHSEAGQPTIKQTTLPGPGGVITEARQTCDFEGVVAWAIGVTGMQRYKVTLLDAPRRVVIDIKR